MIATRTFWRWTKNTLAWPLSDSVIETINEDDRCDWAKGGVYQHLGWAVPI